MRGIAGIHPGWGITVVRVVTAVILIAAGWGKVTGGFEPVSAAFDGMGIPLPGIMGPFVALLELIGGFLLLIGLLGRWLALLFALQFIVITFYVKSPVQDFSGVRIDLMILAAAICMFIAGSGRASVDATWLEKRP